MVRILLEWCLVRADFSRNQVRKAGALVGVLIPQDYCVFTSFDFTYIMVTMGIKGFTTRDISSIASQISWKTYTCSLSVKIFKLGLFHKKVSKILRPQLQSAAVIFFNFSITFEVFIHLKMRRLKCITTLFTLFVKVIDFINSSRKKHLSNTRHNFIQTQSILLNYPTNHNKT